MSTKNYLKHTVTDTPPTFSDVGDEYYSPRTNILYKKVIYNGTNVAYSQIISTGIDGNVPITGNITLSTTSSGVTFGDGTRQTSTKPRVQANTTNSSTYTIDTDSYDMVVITGQSVVITSITTTGTPANGQKLIISITGIGGIPFTLSSSNFEASTISLPTTTASTARLDIGFVWNVATSKWRCVAQA
jgi:hypothetical protein